MSGAENIVAEDGRFDISRVALASVFASPTNPRRNFDAGPMQELIESIKLHGVLQPILVRPMPADECISISFPAYEIVAGERRWRAARAAKLSMIDVKVRDLSDREVLELQIVENLQRADLHPLEEADGYGRMMAAYGFSADELAAKIGKSRAYIYGRMKLLDLGSEGRNAFFEGSITLSVALLIARIPTHRLQAELLLSLIEIADNDEEPASVRTVQRIVRHQYMTDLAKAPFPTDDRTLTSAGSCYQCPKRTGNPPEIFDDVSDADVCTDTVCFGAKKTTHQLRLAAEARARGLTVISGQEAKKVVPYGVKDFLPSSGDGYVNVDARCYEGRHTGKTFREILGDAMDVTLIEDVHSGVLVESMTSKALKDALIAAGVMAEKDENSAWEADRRKKVEKARAETDFRLELWKKVSGRLEELTEPDWPTAWQAAIDRIIAANAWDCSSGTYKGQVTEAAFGKSTAKERDAMRDRILCGRRKWLAVMALEMAVSHELYVNEYLLDSDPTTLTKAALELGIIPADVRKEMARGRALKPRKTTLASLAEESSDKIGLKARTGTKPAKTETIPMFSETSAADGETIGAESGTSDNPAEKASPVTKAARSSESGVLAVKYRHPESGQTWSGRGKHPEWIKVWLLEGKAIEGLEARSAVSVASSDAEENELKIYETTHQSKESRQ